MTTQQKVQTLMSYCLFDEKEAQEGAVLAQGVVAKYGFHPGRLAEKKSEIMSVIAETVTDEFYEAGGGGWTFLKLPVNRTGELWGDQRDAEALMVLAIASGLAKYLLPVQIWDSLPGGVPYVVFDLHGFDANKIN